MNCKAGDLAIVIRSPVADDNLGLLVRVIEAVPEYHTEFAGFAWKVEVVSKRHVLGINADTGQFTNTGADDSSFAIAYDPDLRPIRPGELPDDVPMTAPVDAVSA